MATVQLAGINKVYENGYHAIHDLDLEIADKEFLVLVGPSGCGKSTALRMIAGLETITGGTMKIGEKVVNDVEPKDRDIAMVFQNYALYPHMSVYDNIGFALKLAKVPKEEIDTRVRKAAAILELEDNLDRKPGQLSGGQRQRVAMGRAIVRQPAAFLMDEPLSNLDAKLRVQMRAEIAALQRELAVTTVYVTHDQIEAMTMGDRVAVLKDGYLQQVDTPQNLYDHPVNVFVAAFIGSPSMNLFEGQVQLSGDAGTLRLGSHVVALAPECLVKHPKLRDFDGRTVIVGIRPEDYEDAELAPDVPESQWISSKVTLLESLGSEIMAHFHVDAPTVDSGDPDAIEEKAGAGQANAVGRFNPRSTRGWAMRSRSRSPPRTCTSSIPTLDRRSRPDHRSRPQDHQCGRGRGRPDHGADQRWSRPDPAKRGSVHRHTDGEQRRREQDLLDICRQLREPVGDHAGRTDDARHDEQREEAGHQRAHSMDNARLLGLGWLLGCEAAAGQDRQHRHEEQYPHEFDRHGGGERHVADGRRRCHHLADVVDHHPDPDAEIAIAQADPRTDGGKRERGDGADQGDRGDGVGRLLVGRFDRGSSGGDCRRTADRRADAEQCGEFAPDRGAAADPDGRRQYRHRHHDRHDQRGRSQPGDLVERDPEAEQHDAGAQREAADPGDGTRFVEMDER